MPGEAIIRTDGLTKMFDDFTAVDNVSFQVRKGEIYGLLGPNGAGKSTLIRMLTTLTRPTKGTATIAGYDLVNDDEGVREVVGLVSEKMIMYDRLTAYENLRLFAKLYNVRKEDIDPRLKELLEIVNMTKWTNERIEKFSTGMRQRINVIRALVSMPQVVFMDEPTLGLDPQSTSDIRDLIRRLRDKDGLTIILTTHIMNEADALSDHIGLIDKGRIVAEGSPSELKARITEKGATVLDLDLKDPPVNVAERIKALPDVTSASQSENKVKVIVKHDDAFQDVVEGVMKMGVRIKNANVVMPTLEDVFLHFTGRSMHDKLESKPVSRMHGGGHGPPRFRAPQRGR